ncbi:AraC family transcriptional regulator [Bosea sp. NBC_00550]|uniref:AraC family transcriptional regulator n=1 Tax=Bosea sp. NBC_00550 TaxID=2969621 RepID=UPI00222E0BF9|nr:AraC family transcriptional regulator [Bosea sp. NBC_00550]UZF93371.1 AraC family transcriptional regulator [Bosea sp. NBC_00550]
MRHGTAAAGIERIEAFFRGYAYDPHRHDTYAFGVTLSGVQSFDYRGARRDSLGGHAIVIHPDEVHNGRSGIADGFRYRMLYVEPRLIREALGERGRALPFVSTAVSQDPALVAAVARALRDLDGPLDAMAAEDMVERLADALLALDPSAAGTRPGRIDSVSLARARAYLDAHATDAVDSARLEVVTGLGRFALARQFRAAFGTSPYNYLVMRRLDRARHMLMHNSSLADAAFACGFADQSHLTRQFRRAFGVTPGRWRALQNGSKASR